MPNLKKEFYHLRPGDHLCHIYHTDKDRFYLGVIFVLDGLKRREKVAVIEDEELKDFLREFIDVESSIARGQLLFLDAERYLKKGFDYERLMEDLEEISATATGEGLKGFRFLINFELLFPVEEILEYETRMEKWNKGVTLCMFDERKFDYTTLTRLLLSHPKIISRRRLIENHLYQPSRFFFKETELREEDYTLLMRKITEMHEAKRELGRIQEQYKAIYDSLPDGIVMLKGSVIVGVNSKTLEMLGYTLESILGKKLYELSPPKQPDGRRSKEKMFEEIEVAMEKGSHFFEWRFRKEDGSIIDTEISLSRFMLNGEPHLTGIVRDVTKRKEMEAKLRESEERYRLLVDSSVHAIITINSNTEIVGWNKGAEEIFGYSADEVIGKPLTILIPERFHSRFWKSFNPFKLASKSDRPPQGGFIESTAVRKNGEEFPVEMSYYAWKSGNEVFFTSVLRDISERKRMEEELKESEERFRKIFNTSPNLMALIDRDGVFVEANPAIQRSLGQNPTGKSIFDVLPKDLAESRMKRVAEVIEEDKAIIFQDSKDRREFINTFIPITIRGERYCLVIATEITETRRTERLLRTINEINSLIVYEKDPKRLFSRAAKLIAGLEEHYSTWIGLKENTYILQVASSGRKYCPERVGKDVTCFTEAEKGPVILRKERKPKKCPSCSLDFSCLILPMKVDDRASGFFVIHSTHLLPSTEEIELLQTLVNDLAFANRAIEVDRAKSKAYKQIERNIEEFAILVDQIRNPLSIISGVAELEVKDEKVRQLLIEGVRRIERLVKRLDRGWIESEKVRNFLKRYM